MGHPTGIMGIGVMEARLPVSSHHGEGGPTQPEYVYILQYVGTDTLLMVDSVRWDTASYSILKFPVKADTSSMDSIYKAPRYFRFL